jgi:serine/threonine-protein kinase
VQIWFGFMTDGARVLAGRYRLIGKLVEGGMGTVWRAEHLTLKTHVAVKLIDAAIADSLEATARFEREAQAAAELRSTHIVQILDYGVDEGTPYIVMELLDGKSLSTVISHSGKLSPKHTAQLLVQAARGLSRAHEKGVVHRDLKPDNMFVIREGNDEIVKVLDFGIAKKLDRLTVSGGIKTHTGSVLGSPFYMSPEQAIGAPTIDHRSDIWSFAVVAYECLTGKRPFERDTLGAVFIAISQEPLPVPSNLAPVPCGFDQWFARAAARDPDARFQSILEAAQQLQAVCDQPMDVLTTTAVIPTPRLSAGDFGEPLSVIPSSTPSDTAPPSALTVPGYRRTRAFSWKLALVPVAALVLVIAYLSWRPRRAAPPVASALPDVAAPAISATRLRVQHSASDATPPPEKARDSAAFTSTSAPPQTAEQRRAVAKPEKRVTVPAIATAAGRTTQVPVVPSAGASTRSPSTHSHDDVFVGF